MCYPILTLCDHQSPPGLELEPHKAWLSPLSEYSINSDGLLCSICKQSLLAVSLMPAIQLTQLITLTRWLWCRQSEKLSGLRCDWECGDLMHHFYYSPLTPTWFLPGLAPLKGSPVPANISLKMQTNHCTAQAGSSLFSCPVQSDKFHQTRNYLWAQ